MFDEILEFPRLIGVTYEQLIAAIFYVGMQDPTYSTQFEDAFIQFYELLTGV